MRRHYLDNIRWITVGLVVLYHVIFMYTAPILFHRTGSDFFCLETAGCHERVGIVERNHFKQNLSDKRVRRP